MLNARRRKIEKHKRDIASYLDELDEADDADLWEEMDGKMFDVMLVYRRSQESPETFTFSDGETRNLTAMAASHAVAEVHPELDQDDEFPAWMGRGERGA
jgi:Mg/Co/Ni transporter MgtE